MNLKRAIWIGILTYVSSFILGGLVMFAMGINPEDSLNLSTSVLVISIVVSIILAALFTLLYFRDKKIKSNAKEGFYFGIVLVVIGVVLDVIIFTLFSGVSGTQQTITEYYSNPLFWLSLIFFIVTTTLVGLIKGRK